MDLKGEMFAAVGFSILCAVASCLYFVLKKKLPVTSGFPFWKIGLIAVVIIMAVILIKNLSGYFAAVESV